MRLGTKKLKRLEKMIALSRRLEEANKYSCLASQAATLRRLREVQKRKTTGGNSS